MSYFIATVVVHHHTSAQDYARLHEALARIQFVRLIFGSDGQWYEMPHSTYVYVFPGLLDINALRDRVANVVDATLPSSTPAHVLITQTDRLSWRLRPGPDPLANVA